MKGANAMSKVSVDFIGECELRELPKGTFFRIIRGGKVSRETYVKSFYDHSIKRYNCDKCSDIFLGL